MRYRVIPSSRRRDGHGAVARAFLVAVALAAVAACAGPPGAADTADSLAVLGLDPGSTPGTGSGQWLVESVAPLDLGQVTVVNKDGVPALRLTNGPNALAVVHEIGAALLATPYLSWAWNMDSQGAGIHPARLIVGFRGGRPEDGSLTKRLFAWQGVRLPPAERALTIVWADSALQRGNLTAGSGDADAMPAYTVRGGRENAGSWWLETVDLADLYARAWPADDLGHTEVAFVAVAAVGDRRPVAGYLSGIVLSR